MLRIVDRIKRRVRQLRSLIWIVGGDHFCMVWAPIRLLLADDQEALATLDQSREAFASMLCCWRSCCN